MLFVALAITVASALANWWSRWTDHRATEVWSKPLVLVGLIAAAVLLDPVDPLVRAWFVAALVLSLLGDVFLLGSDRWFIPGLVAFLAGHAAYTIGFVAAEEWRWWSAGVGLVAAAVLAATIGRRIVMSAAEQAPALGGAVVAYLGVILIMAVAALAAGNGWAVAGAMLFVGSDTVLGWNRFVRSWRFAPIVIMVSYHLAQFALVVSLL